MTFLESLRRRFSSQEQDTMAKKKTTKAAAKAAGAPAAPTTAVGSIPGIVQYTALNGKPYRAYVTRRNGEVFDLSYFVGQEKRLVPGVVQGTTPGTWQVLPQGADDAEA